MATSYVCLQPLCTSPCSFLTPPSLPYLPKYSFTPLIRSLTSSKEANAIVSGEGRRGSHVVCNGWLLPVDPWAPTIDSQSIASQLFALSLFPYIGFLYFITKSKSSPGLTLFGFYFLLAFVGATIPAGIYAKVKYGTSLSNVDWLHGGAESLLTLTNLFIVLGLRQALRSDNEKETSSSDREIKEKKKTSV